MPQPQPDACSCKLSPSPVVPSTGQAVAGCAKQATREEFGGGCDSAVALTVFLQLMSES